MQEEVLSLSVVFASDRNDLDGKRVQNLIKRLILQTFNNVCEISLFFFGTIERKNSKNKKYKDM